MGAHCPPNAPVVQPVEQPVVSGSRAGSRTKTRPAKCAGNSHQWTSGTSGLRRQTHHGTRRRCVGGSCPPIEPVVQPVVGPVGQPVVSGQTTLLSAARNSAACAYAALRASQQLPSGRNFSMRAVLAVFTSDALAK